MRLDKYLSHCNIGSRNKVKQIIRQKQVIVNDKIIFSGKLKINPNKDLILINNEKVNYEEHTTFILNKPQGYISATKDKIVPTVIDLIKEKELQKKLRLIGRLDINTTGLLILTTNKDLIRKIIHPKAKITKKYLVELKNPIRSFYQIKFKEGIYLNNYHCLPAEYETINEFSCYLTIIEGKFHQIKRMFKQLENEVTNLKRIAIGNLFLSNELKLGQYIKVNCNQILKMILGEINEN